MTATFTERYNLLRRELIDTYAILTKWTFSVITTPSSFMTFEQLEKRRKNPPIQGFEYLMQPMETPLTVERLLQGIDIMGEDLELGFRNPRRDIPVIYEGIQKWIQHWIEIKTNWSYLQSPPIEELERQEKLGRYLFTAYAHYYHERVNKDMAIDPTKPLTLHDILRGQMMHGKDYGQPISYISHLDQYKSSIGYSTPSYGASSSTLDFLRGFGGGL